MTTAVESDHARCICGKLSFSQEEANDVVRRAVVSRVLHRNARRAEQRSYPCDRNPGVWHVTSSKDARPLTNPDGSLIMDYGPNDDTMAVSVIAKVLAMGNDSHWVALLAPGRASQTRRALVRIREEFNVLKTAQGRAKELSNDRHILGEIDSQERYEIKKAYYAWKEQVAPFRVELTQRLLQAEQADLALRQKAKIPPPPPRAPRVVDCKSGGLAHNDEYLAALMKKNERLRASAMSNSEANTRHRKAAELLALAIAAHRGATGSPTPADSALWSALDEVTVPQGRDGEATVGELIASGAWTPFDPSEQGDQKDQQEMSRPRWR